MLVEEFFAVEESPCDVEPSVFAFFARNLCDVIADEGAFFFGRKAREECKVEGVYLGGGVESNKGAMFEAIGEAFVEVFGVEEIEALLFGDVRGAFVKETGVAGGLAKEGEEGRGDASVGEVDATIVLRKEGERLGDDATEALGGGSQITENVVEDFGIEATYGEYGGYRAGLE